MSRIKLLYIIPDMSNAGPVNMCLNLIKGLGINDYDIKIAALGEGVGITEFAKYGDVKVFSRKDIFLFRDYVKCSNFDIIHSHTIIADVFSRLTKTNAIKLTTIHNYPDVDSIYRRGNLMGGGLYQLQKYAIKKFFKVACSHAVKEYCQSILKMRDVTAIPNGVPVKIIPRDIKKDSLIRFYYLGGISKRKNVSELLEAFSLWSRDKNVSLSIIGNGPLLSALSEKYSNNKITFLGKIEDPDIVINEFDCFVSSSKAEGMPLALLESLSLGKAYICSNIAPHNEVFYNDKGRGGYIYDVGNVKALITKLDDYYRNNNKFLMSDCAKQCFERYYHVSIMCAGYDKMYKSLMRNSGLI